MEPIKLLDWETESLFEKVNEIIIRLNELSEMMNKKKVTLDEYVEKISPKPFKDEKLWIEVHDWGFPFITGFKTKQEAEAALKLLTDNPN